jgi:predicted metalloprotease
MAKKLTLTKRARKDQLNYIEDTFSQLGRLEKVAQRASSDAIKKAKRHKRSITYLEKGWIVTETPNGRKLRIKELNQSKLQTRPAGAKYRLS